MKVDFIKRGDINKALRVSRELNRSARANDTRISTPLKVRDEVGLSSCDGEDIKLTPEEKKLITYIYVRNFMDDVLYSDDPHKYVHIPWYKSLESRAFMPTLFISSLASLVPAAAGYMLGGIPGLFIGSVAALIANGFIVGLADEKEREVQDEIYREVITKIPKDKRISIREAIKRLRKHKPVYLIHHIWPKLKVVKFSSVEEGYRKLRDECGCEECEAAY